MPNPIIPAGQASYPGTTMDWLNSPLDSTAQALQRRRDLEAARSRVWEELSPYAYRRDTTSLKAKALIEELEVIDAEIESLSRVAPFVEDKMLQRGEWEKALDARLEKEIASGTVSEKQALSTRNSALDKLNEWLPTYLNRQPQADQTLTGQGGVFGAENTPPITESAGGTPQGTAGTGMDLTDPWMLQAIGVPAHVILAAQSGDTTAIPNWVASQNQATEAQTGYDQLALTQAEQLRQQMQQSQIERDVLSGVLGGLAPSGAISPQNIQDYMGEQGVYGDITRAYYNQLTGNPTPWQMQQWQAEQDRYAQTLAMQQQQVAADNAYRQQALAQQAAYQQAMLEQQRREMAAQIGQAVANMANQSYMDTLGYRLPAGTQYAPGFEPGGTLSQMASMSGLNYNPSKIGVANPPTTDELMRTVQEAIGRF